jgi:hypothetical protein
MNQPCTLKLTSQTLSAWRSRLLVSTEQEAIAQHIPTCQACQHILADYERVALALRQQTVPPTGPALWRATQTRITTFERGHMQQRQKYFVAGSLGLLAILVLSFALILVSVMPNQGSSAPPTATRPTATATATIIPTATPPPLQVTPSQGWVASVSYAKDIAFAPSAPLTGYVCGNTAQFSPLSLDISVTHDGGRTWSAAQTTPNKDATCHLSINPTNPLDVVMTGISCWVQCGDGGDTSYRSQDGGHSWTLMQLTDKGNIFPLFNPVWAGNALFTQPFVPGNFAQPPLPPHNLAVSIAGGAVAWANDAPIQQAIGQNGSTQLIMAAQGTAFLAFAMGKQCPDFTFCDAFQTSDGGATWQQFTIAGDGYPDEIISPEAIDGTLIGLVGALTGVSSTDGGHTWVLLPPPPGGSSTSIVAGSLLPDGSFYADLATSTARYFAVLAPSSTTWVKVADPPFQPNGADSYHFATVSLKADGTANALWIATETLKNGTFLPGVSYHALTP